MTVDECIQKYEELMGKIFSGWPKTRLVAKGEYYSASDLESAIRNLIREKLGDENALLLDEENPCKM